MVNWEESIIDTFRRWESSFWKIESKIRDIERRLDNLEEVTQTVDPWESSNE